MISTAQPKIYPPVEEVINIVSHACGFILSVAGLVLLIQQAASNGGPLLIVSFTLFGSALVVLFGISTTYHMTRSPLLRSRLRILDHASIYILIAGTYTPFTLVTLQGATGWTLFGISWGMAVVGITLKVFFTGHFIRLSTAVYVFMGWLIVFAIVPLVEQLPAAGLRWLIAGGIAYTLGAVLYGIKRIPFNHAIFHLFVLAGSACHFIAVYNYVR